MKKFRHKQALLYKISGQGLKKPSYLLGTMHMVCAAEFAIPEKVLRTLAKCRAYYMEVDLGSSDELSQMEQQESGGHQLTNGLSPDEIMMLNQLLLQQLSITLEEAQHLPVVELVNRMTSKAITCDEVKVAEFELLKMATQGGLLTAGLETVAEQVAIANQVFTGRELLLQLRLSDDYHELFDEMMKAYRQEDLEKLAALVTHKKLMSDNAYDHLVVKRNLRWAAAIPEIMSSGSTLIAVGAGHLPGEHGLLQLLTNQGYAVNPVYR